MMCRTEVITLLFLSIASGLASKLMTITGPDEVKYGKTLTLTCITPDMSLLPLTWFAMGFTDMVQVQPDKGIWMSRTRIFSLTTPDNDTTSVLQIDDCSFQDERMYECRSSVQDTNTTISALHFVSVPNVFAITGPDVVRFQENLTLTCTAPYLSMLPLTWFHVSHRIITKIEPDKGRWKYRTTITTITNPDNSTSSVLKIDYCSIHDRSVYECRSSVQKDTNTTSSALHFLSVLYDTCTDKDKMESLYIPGKGCLFVSTNAVRDKPCNHISITHWKEQLVASDIISEFVSNHGIGGIGEQHFLIKLTNDKRNFQWGDFTRDGSKRLTFTAWLSYDYADVHSTCVSISIRGEAFRNWVYSRCSMGYAICLDSIEKEGETEKQPTRIPETSTVNMTRPGVLGRLFRCTQTGEYILSYFVCDHHPDCMDQSDESQACQTSTSETNVETFRCDNGKYISLNLVCDFYQDCYDGSDERNCFKSACLSGQWTCHNGQCIAGYDVCDSEEECADGSDEWSTTCNGHSKQIQTVWPCALKRHVPIYRMCDRIPDCYDGSDEKDCKYGNPTYSCSTHCLERECNDSFARVHLASNGYETVYCSYRDDLALTTWPFSTLIGTMAEQKDCYFSTKDTEYTTVMLINKQPVSIQYKSEHILEGLIKHSRDCFQLVELCFEAFSYPVPHIQFSSEFDGRNMQNLTYCGNVRSTCDPYYGCYQDSPIYNKFCLDKNTFVTGPNVPIRWIKLQSDNKSKPVLRITPPVCTEDKALIEPKYLEPQQLCQNGMSYYPHHRCLMDFDVTGEPCTCRDLTHLQNCETFSCPENFMKCPDSYCLHIRFLCDGVPHCPNKEDEQLCDSFACPGHFRCHDSRKCIPLGQVCDGVGHCPRADDERHCDLTCPDGCSCQGLIFHCVDNKVNKSRILGELPETLRGLTIQIPLSDWRDNLPMKLPAVSVLSMQHCNISSLSFSNNSVLLGLNSLISLDLSHNNITIVPAHTFAMLLRLKYLTLSHNPIITLGEMAFSGLHLLKELYLIGSQLNNLSSNTFIDCGALTYLNLSSNQINWIDHDAFNNLAYVKTLDLRNNRIQLAEHMFKGLTSLGYLYVDSYTLCCAKPVSVTDPNCFAPRDSISSCTDLIRLSILRVALWIIGLCAVFGNLFVLIYRLKYDRVNLMKSYSIFVINLSLSDILMGIYMIIIGVADAAYRDRYVWEEETWRHSITCTASGMLSTISSEASAFVILFITLDRTVAIVFPFSFKQFTKTSAIGTSVVIWIISVVIAILPVSSFRDYFQGEFYSSSGVCLALPLSDSSTPGSGYSVAIFVGLNFVIFIVIAVCQVVIYRKSRTHMTLRRTTNKQDTDIAVARALTAVVATDFFCWFPIGVLGIWTSLGGSVSGDVYAWVMVFVLPINSALNPFLYTFANTWKKRKLQMQRHSSYRGTKSETEMTNVVLDVLKTFRHKKGSKPLTEFLCSSETELRVREAFNIIQGLSKRLVYLHSQELVHGNISAESVHISLKSNKVTDADFSMDHHRVSRDFEQCNDMYDLGMIVKVLLKKIKLP